MDRTAAASDFFYTYMLVLCCKQTFLHLHVEMQATSLSSSRHTFGSHVLIASHCYAHSEVSLQFGRLHLPTADRQCVQSHIERCSKVGAIMPASEAHRDAVRHKPSVRQLTARAGHLISGPAMIRCAAPRVSWWLCGTHRLEQKRCFTGGVVEGPNSVMTGSLSGACMPAASCSGARGRHDQPAAARCCRP